MLRNSTEINFHTLFLSRMFSTVKCFRRRHFLLYKIEFLQFVLLFREKLISISQEKMLTSKQSILQSIPWIPDTSWPTPLDRSIGPFFRGKKMQICRCCGLSVRSIKVCPLLGSVRHGDFTLYMYNGDWKRCLLNRGVWYSRFHFISFLKRAKNYSIWKFWNE